MFKRLTRIAHSARYWIALIVLGIIQEAFALYYQYVLDYAPCVLCIHVRLLVLGIIVVAIAALLLRKLAWTAVIAHAITSLCLAVLLERSWQLYATEHGMTMGACDFDLGFPAWLAFDRWLPFMFEVQASCGYTPVLPFGITMAEALLVMSSILFLVSATLTLNALLVRFRND